ncbi:hypothetical protein HanRHA438_Chr11g0487491 [Helianthus annuus]|nr:hypothetical protein HanRHA438_Chr11g0487491 [Helianthus annuus]
MSRIREGTNGKQVPEPSYDRSRLSRIYFDILRICESGTFPGFARTGTYFPLYLGIN